jgi:hypothetical protein
MRAPSASIAMDDSGSVDRMGMALLGTAAVLVWNDVAEEGRRQFYEWHDKEHIPERLSIPGFRRGRRYAKSGHSPQWFTMYEARDAGVVTSREYLARLDAPTEATTRALAHFRNTSRAVCRIARSAGSSSGGYALTLRLSARGADALSRFASSELFPDLLAMTGIVACHLFVADETASRTPTAEARTRAFDVPSWVLLVEATTSWGAEDALRVIAPRLSALGAAFRDDAAVYALEICRLAAGAFLP